MILAGEADARAHLPVAPLALSETPSETITTRIATNDEVALSVVAALIVAMSVNDPFLPDQAVASLQPKDALMVCQTTDHRWIAERATATQNVFLSKRAS